MNWIALSLFSATIQAGVSIVKSHLLSKRQLELRTYMLATGLIQALYGILLLILFPWPERIEATGIINVILASVCGLSALVITLFILQKEEVSRVVPIGSITPVYITIFAVVFLQEHLSILQWIAVLITVAGVTVIATEKGQVVVSRSLKRPFTLLFFAGILAAASSIFTKIALQYMSFWNMYGLAILIVAVMIISFSLRPITIHTWKTMDNKWSVVSLILFSEIAGLSASVLYVQAVSLGPVSLVSAIGNISPVIVLLFSAGTGLLLPGFILHLPEKKTLLYRVIATILITIGVSIIAVVPTTD